MILDEPLEFEATEFHDFSEEKAIFEQNIENLRTVHNVEISDSHYPYLNSENLPRFV